MFGGWVAVHNMCHFVGFRIRVGVPATDPSDIFFGWASLYPN